MPPPGKVQVKFGFTVKDIWTIERPPENQLPMANFSYRPLFASLSISNVLVVVGCLLQETRVALVSQHYALLGPVAEALLSFLFPLHWQGLYLTLVPRNMLDILDAPVPYLVGLHARYLRETPAEDRPHGVVFVDLDRDEVHLGFADDDASAKRIIPSLPERDAGKLKDMLMKHAACAYVMPSTQVVGSITTGKGEQSKCHCGIGAELACGVGLSSMCCSTDPYSLQQIRHNLPQVLTASASLTPRSVSSRSLHQNRWYDDRTSFQTLKRRFVTMNC